MSLVERFKLVVGDWRNGLRSESLLEEGRLGRFGIHVGHVFGGANTLFNQTVDFVVVRRLLLSFEHRLI